MVYTVARIVKGEHRGHIAVMDDSREILEETFRGRCTAAQKRLWEEAARYEKRSLSDWIRIALDEAAEKAVTKAKKRKK